MHVLLLTLVFANVPFFLDTGKIDTACDISKGDVNACQGNILLSCKNGRWKQEKDCNMSCFDTNYQPLCFANSQPVGKQKPTQSGTTISLGVVLAIICSLFVVVFGMILTWYILRYRKNKNLKHVQELENENGTIVVQSKQNTEYVAIQDYTPCRSDEMAITTGDNVLLHVLIDENWGSGHNETTNAFGLFPLSYVERL